MTFQLDAATCSGTVLRADCTNLGIHMDRRWTFSSTGYSGNLAADSKFTSSNGCTESETLVGTLTE